jgi:hypothetical protein
MDFAHATLSDVSTLPPPRPVEVQFNPTELGIDLGANYAELQVPGLPVPLLQFVRGEAQGLSLELFLDGTDTRKTGAPADTVEARLKQLRAFVQINPKLHAPPVCLFKWNQLEFQGVMTSLKERYSLFAPTGRVLRARATVTFKSYKAAEVQLRELKKNSPDRTHVRVLREGETLAHVAHEAYGDPRLWRVIAEDNGIDRPRFVPVGTPLRLRAL